MSSQRGIVLGGTSKRHKESRTIPETHEYILNDLVYLLKMTLSNQQLKTLMLHSKKSFGRNQFLSPDNQDLFTYQTQLQKFLYEENANMWSVLICHLIANCDCLVVNQNGPQQNLFDSQLFVNNLKVIYLFPKSVALYLTI